MLRLCYARKNRYFRCSRLSEAKFRTIMRYFTHDLPASKLAALSDVSRLTINQRFFKLRPKIAQLCDASSPFSGEVEEDESSFGARRIRGKKGRGAGGKTIVFGILEQQGKVYTEIAPNAPKKPLQAVIRGQIPSFSIIHSDGLEGLQWAGGYGLSEASPRPSVMNLHEAIAISTALNHSGHRLNGGLQNSRAFPDMRFIYHLKECEFRFNHREENLYDKYSLC